jgi:signal transduction histidine kinase
LPYSLATGVALGPGGGLVIQHGEDNLLSYFDGYEVKQIPPSDQLLLGVQSGSFEKVWALYRDGFMQYEGGRWVPVPVKEIAAALNGPGREHGPLRWCSVRPDCVLFLIDGKLFEHDAGKAETRLVLDGNQTRLGPMTDLGPGPTGTVWLTGRDGVELLGPDFSGTAVLSGAKTFAPPAGLAVKNLRRPMKDDDNGVVMLGEEGPDGKAVWVRWAEGAWQTGPLPDKRVQRAWRSPDGTLWFLSPRTLYRLEPGRAMVKEPLSATQYWDVAVDEAGVFSVATSEGIHRYSPLPWQAPVGLQPKETPVQSIRQDAEGRLWCACEGGVLLTFNRGEWRTVTLPDADSSAPQRPKRLVTTATGQVLCGLGDRLYACDTGGNHFVEIQHPSGGGLKLLGALPDGAALIQVLPLKAAADGYQLESFDGKQFTPSLVDGLVPSMLGDLTFVWPARNGDLWLGGVSGVARLHGKKWESFQRGDGVFAMVELARGKYWFGGRNRIDQFDGEHWEEVRSGFDRVNAMVRTHDGSIWAAVGNGLYRFYKNSWIYLAQREGLPYSTINDVFEDQSGKLWAATTVGMSLFHPATDLDPPRSTVVLNKATNNNRLNDVSFTVQGRDRWQMTQDVRLLFAWQLDEAPWTAYEKRSQLVFSGLAAGRHELKVRAMDVSGNEEMHPVTLGFVIPMPWYRDSRIQVVLLGSIALVLFFAGLAVNRHRELARSYARVEVMVQQRTRELEQVNRELLHNQKMTALGTLAAGIAHDFNGILSVIKGSVQIIDKNLADAEKVRWRISRISTVIRQAESLVQAMLSYSRHDDSKTQECDVNAAVEESLLLLDESLLRNIRLQLALDAERPTVRGSPEQVEQILSNLLINAADAMDGRGRIQVRTGRLGAPPNGSVLSPAPAVGYAFVSVTDEGCGIEPENLARIFEPFFTTKDLSTRHGVGLGLYMVFELSKNLGAGLHVSSTPAQGSTFTLVIPLAGAAMPIPAAGSDSVSKIAHDTKEKNTNH